MELKVWVEGIQRVVCGLTETSTCHDVILVLANAIGRTGRFTLVEQWRDTERLIPPNESPLQVLHKWGEYAHDVRFILRWSDSTAVTPSKSTVMDLTPRGSAFKGTSDRLMFTPNRSTPEDQQNTSLGPESRSSLKKSLTFSGSQRPFVSGRPRSARPGCGRQLIMDNSSSLDSYDDDQSSPSTSSSPYSSVRLMNGHSFDAGWSKTNGQMSNRHHNHSRSSSSTSASGSGVYSPNNSITNRQRTHGPHVNGSPQRTNGTGADISPMARLTLNNTSHSYSIPNAHVRSASNSSTNGTPSHRTYSPQRTHNLTHPGQNGEIKGGPSVGLNGLNGEYPQEYKLDGSIQTSDCRTIEHNSKEHEELLRLVQLQKDKLDKQHSSIDELSTEIRRDEQRHLSSEIIQSNDSLLEAEAEHSIEVKMSELSSEIQKLMSLSVKQDDELQELELVSWQDKLKIETQQKDMLHSELNLLRSRIKTAESELEQQVQQTSQLAEEISSLKRQQDSSEEQQKVADQQQKLEADKLRERELQNDQKSLEHELTESDEQLASRELQLSDLERQLRQDNLQVFCTANNLSLLNSSDETSLRRSPLRPGSARKMTYSPQMMKNTNNPGGYWV